MHFSSAPATNMQRDMPEFDVIRSRNAFMWNRRRIHRTIHISNPPVCVNKSDANEIVSVHEILVNVRDAPEPIVESRIFVKAFNDASK